MQQQIDGLATKDDMQAKLDQMQTAVNDAKATAEEALEKANAAGDADKIAELEGRIADLEETLGDIDAMKEEIQNALDSQIADFREEMEELLKQVEELTGYSLGMVTGIEFQAAEEADENGNAKYDSRLDVNYARVKISYPKDLLAGGGERENNVTTYEFGEGLTGAFTLTNGEVNTVADYMLVNVNPANAVISNDMLSLVNANGENLNDYVNMTSAPWSGTIVKSRASQDTGLRLVGVQLKEDVDFDAFDKLVLPGDAHHGTSSSDECKHGYIAYALSVTDAEKDRTVTSAYDVTLHVLEEPKAVWIERATTINSDAASQEHSSTISAWNDGKDEAGIPEDCYPVELGSPFTVNVGAEEGRIMASYIVVDYDNAKLSNTDKAALKGLSFSGVDTVLKGEELTHAITVSGIAGIPVPLKLVTVDYTGNVEVNMIWVKAGEAVTVNAAYTVTPTAYVADGTIYECKGDKQAFTIPATAKYYSIELTAGETAHSHGGTHTPTIFETAKNIEFVNSANTNLTKQILIADGNINVLKLLKADKKTLANKLEEVAYAEFVGTLNLQMMREDKAYEGVVKFYDNTGTYLGANSIEVTKKLPTAVPSDFSAKTNNIVNGVMTVYPKPVTGSPNGEYTLNNAFNNWTKYYTLDIDGITNTDPEKGKYTAATDSKIENISKDVINDQKSYDAAVGYNYGEIKYVPEGHGVDGTAYEHIVPWTTAFAFQFNDWVVDCEYQWSETPVVYYRVNTSEPQIIMGKVTKNDKGEVTDFENVIKARTPYNSIVDPFDADDTDWTTWADALNVANGENERVRITLITNNNGKEIENEFFTATFVIVDSDGNEVTSGTTGAKNAIKLQRTGAEVKVGADIETKVVLEIKDKFGHTHKVPAEGLTFTMKINEE